MSTGFEEWKAGYFEMEVAGVDPLLRDCWNAAFRRAAEIAWKYEDTDGKALFAAKWIAEQIEREIAGG